MARTSQKKVLSIGNLPCSFDGGGGVGVAMSTECNTLYIVYNPLFVTSVALSYINIFYYNRYEY